MDFHVLIRRFSIAVILIFASTRSPSLAVTLTGIGVTNTSDADQVLTPSPGRTIEFRSAVSEISAVTTSGLISEFGTHVSWFLGHEVDPDSFPFANIALRHVSYELSFTVNDPGNAGYSLAIDTDLRGYLTSQFDSGAQTVSGTQASGTALYGKFDSGSGYGPLIGNLTVTPDASEVAKANYLDTFDNVLVQDASSFSAGDFIGTKTFRVLFSSRPSPNVSSIIQNSVWGRNGVRFGLNPTVSDLNELLTPGIDGEASSALGHFVKVQVTAKSASVPSTSNSALLLAISVMATLAVRFRIAARGEQDAVETGAAFENTFQLQRCCAGMESGSNGGLSAG